MEEKKINDELLIAAEKVISFFQVSMTPKQLIQITEEITRFIESISPCSDDV